MAKIISNRVIKQSTVGEQLGRIKDNIKDSYDYFADNYRRYNEARRFIFETSLTQAQIAFLQDLGRPIIEINIGEAYLSRLRGEFFKQEPSLSVRPKDGSNINPQLLQLLENHIRAIFFDANLDGMEYQVYTDVLVGFSAIEIYTDYLHEYSFDQGIFMRRCHDPTLIGFDKAAILPHKGDGNFAFKFIPMSKERFESEHGSTSNMKFSNSIEGFTWSYTTQTDEVVLVCDYYEKKHVKQKIVRLITGEVKTLKEYEEGRDKWNRGIQYPGIIGKPRETDIVQICRTRLVEDQVLEYAETDFKHLPLIFVDGNSQIIRNGAMGSAKQITRDYTYNLRGVQGLKNLAGISLANELQNTTQTKWIAPIEGLVEQYQSGLLDAQSGDPVIYRSYHNNDPNKPIEKPSPVPRQPAPPEIAQAFTLADQASQVVLGTFDAALGINDNQLSGVAIIEAATQSNATAMPYLVGYLQALNQAGVIFLDLFPKYYPPDIERSIPIKDVSGKRTYANINGNNPLKMDYKPETLEIKIEAGVNFEIQRARAYQMFVELAKDFPIFQQFMQEPEVLEAILDNVDIRGIDSMKQAIPRFMQKMQQQQQMSAQLNPMTIKMQELQIKSQQNQVENQLDAARIQNEQESNATDRMLALAKVGEITDNTTLQANKIQAENARSAVEMATQVADMHHSHKMDEHNKAMDLLSLHHQNEHKNADRKQAASKNGVS